jgi:hypothetical protein
MLGSVPKIKSVVTQLNGPVSNDDKTVADTKIIIIIIIYNVTLTPVCENMSYCTTERIFFKDRYIYKAYDSALMAVSFVFNNSLMKNLLFIKKKLSLKIHGAAFTRSQGKYMKYVSFP